MKTLGKTSLVLGGILFVIYVGAWVDLFFRYIPAEVVRIGFTLWPGNAIGFGLLVFAITFLVCGVRLLEK